MQLLYASTLASIAFALALTVPALLPRPDPLPLWLPDARAARRAPRTLCGNMFDDSGSLCHPRPARRQVEEVAKCEGPTLLGIVHGESAHGESADHALFAELGVVKQGESFGPGFALTEVHANRTVLTRDGERCEVLLFPAVGRGSSTDTSSEDSSDNSADNFLPGAGHFALRRGRFQIPRGDLSSLARVRASPMERGVLLGRVRPDSMAASIGLQSGDLIAEVNGQLLTQESILELAGTLYTLTRFTVLIRRGAETFTVDADIID